MRKAARNATVAVTRSANPMKLYTKTGDKGETSIYGGKRVSKGSLQVKAYGEVDELNSSLGILLTKLTDTKEINDFLTLVQNDLFVIGNHLAGGKESLEEVKKRMGEMEKLIDKLWDSLPPLSHFVIPGGGKAGAFAHLSRSISRRAERETVALDSLMSVDKNVLIYLNRLSDLLFAVARYLNHKDRIEEKIWKGKSS